MNAGGARVLVTGAGGFIGRPTLPLLVAAGFDVHAVSSRPRPDPGAGVTWHQADLLAADQVEATCAAVGASHLLHLAWVTTPGAYTRDPSNLDWTAASLRLVRSFAEHGGKRLVTAGTCFEYEHVDAVLNESTSPLRPATLYGTCKVATQAVVARFAEEVGLSAAWGRVFFLYGPHEHPNRLVSSVILALLDGRPAQTTPGTQVRDFLHVDDVAGGFAALLASDVAGPVNLGGGVGVALRDLASEIGALTGRPDLVHVGARPMPPNEPPRIVADATRVRDEVGFTPRYALRDGLRATIDWWSRERDHATPSRSDHP